MPIDEHQIETILHHANQKYISSFKFIHVLNVILGPNIPEYITQRIKEGKVDEDIRKKCIERFPEYAYLSLDDDVCKLKTKQLYHFSQIRKLLIKEWRVNHEGP